MSKVTYQTKKWTGEFGRKYTKRNDYPPSELDRLYRKNFGISRTELNRLFVGGFSRDIRILEVGANMGNQLLLLQKMGFKNLYGIEINPYAVEYAKLKSKSIILIHGSAFDIPFKDKYFDLVFTSGVLIHIHPSSIREAIKEIFRCSRKYIWGFEYYSEKYVPGGMYRGEENMFWKADFSRICLDLSRGAKLVKEKRIKYLETENMDTMFLIRKGQ